MAKVGKLTASFFIGLFVILGFGLICGAIIWLSANEFSKEKRFFVTYFDGSVEGLEPGRAVKYQGVPVGNVTAVRVAPDGRLIEIVMQIDKSVEINDSLRVKAEMANIAGGKFLQLFYPQNSRFMSMYPAISFKTPYRMIKSTPSGIEEIEIAAKEVMDNLRSIEMAKISDRTIKFLESSTEFFNNPGLYSIVDKVDLAGSRINSLLLKADSSRVISNLNYASDEVLATSKYLKSFADNLNNQASNLKMPERLDKAFSRYDTTMIEATKAVTNLSAKTETALFNLSETISDLRNTQKQLRKSLRVINDAPSQIFLADPPPKEKEK